MSYACLFLILLNHCFGHSLSFLYSLFVNVKDYQLEVIVLRGYHNPDLLFCFQLDLFVVGGLFFLNPAVMRVASLCF